MQTQQPFIISKYTATTVLSRRFNNHSMPSDKIHFPTTNHHRILQNTQKYLAMRNHIENSSGKVIKKFTYLIMYTNQYEVDLPQTFLNVSLK